MVARLVDLAVRRPWALLVGNLVFLAASMALAIAGTNGLSIGSLAPAGSAGGEPDLIVATTGRVPVDSGVYRVALRVISSQVRSDAAVAQVRQGSVSAALLLDYENVDNRSYAPARPDERRWAVHALINF